MEYGEDIFTCVERETLEETGLVVRGVKVVGVTNDIFVEAGKHYITIFAKCDRVDKSQEPEVCSLVSSFSCAQNLVSVPPSSPQQSCILPHSPSIILFPLSLLLPSYPFPHSPSHPTLNKHSPISSHLQNN